MKNEKPYTTFRLELKRAIRRTVASLKQDGTCGASIDCLRQIVPSPSKSLHGAPCGTNAQYFYAEMFAQVLGEMTFRGFTIIGGGK